jgi:hypothetical protein
MAIFSGKQILKAVFTNNANDTIELVYDHKSDGKKPEYISIWIPATDPTNENLIALKEAGWSFERIARETHENIDVMVKARQERIHRQIDAKVKAQVDKYYEIINTETEMTREQIAAAYEQRYAEMINTGPAITTTIFQSVLDNNADEELLFKSKLAAFELPQIKNLKDRAVKQKIRTAKSLMELFGILDFLLQEDK